MLPDNKAIKASSFTTSSTEIRIKWEIRKMIYYIRSLIWKHITFMFAVNISNGIIEKLRIFLDYDEPKLICQWLCFTKNIFHTIRVHIFPRHCLLWLIVSILHLIMALTHLPLDKMAAISADDIFKCIFLNENDGFRIRISLKCISSSSVNKKTSIGSGNGLALNRRQAITWNNDDPLH